MYLPLLDSLFRYATTAPIAVCTANAVSAKSCTAPAARYLSEKYVRAQRTAASQITENSVRIVSLPENCLSSAQNMPILQSPAAIAALARSCQITLLPCGNQPVDNRNDALFVAVRIADKNKRLRPDVGCQALRHLITSHFRDLHENTQCATSVSQMLTPTIAHD